MCSLKHFACINALHLAFILKIHTQMNVEKRQYLILSLEFPFNHILWYLLTPWKKYLTFRTTDNRKKRKKKFFFFENEMFPLIVDS